MMPTGGVDSTEELATGAAAQQQTHLGEAIIKMIIILKANGLKNGV